MNMHTPPQRLGIQERRESFDTYSNIVLPPRHGWRVILCRDGIQWILQRSRLKAGQTAWKNVRHQRNRDALIRSGQALCPALAISALRTLPAWCGR